MSLYISLITKIYTTPWKCFVFNYCGLLMPTYTISFPFGWSQRHFLGDWSILCLRYITISINLEFKRWAFQWEAFGHKCSFPRAIQGHHHSRDSWLNHSVNCQLTNSKFKTETWNLRRSDSKVNLTSLLYWGVQVSIIFCSRNTMLWWKWKDGVGYKVN